MRWFVRRDLDGFFGLFIDNLVQLLLIITLCGSLCGMTGTDAHFITHVILPGAAMSILVGNVFYASQALRIARREKRDDVTALPYGINTPSLLVYVFFVMAPVYNQTGSAQAAWQMGLLACFGSGLIEFLGSFVAESVRKSTPRAALLATLAGIAIGFISMTFALQIWTRPLVAMVPMGIVLITYFSGVRFPLGLPGGLIAVVVGTILAWALPADWTGLAISIEGIGTAWEQRGFCLPHWSGGVLWEVITRDPKEWLPFLSVIIPMGLFNVAGSLQNIESAEAGGDRFDTRSSLAVNGMGTILAALFGSCFPTTIYIGHPGWKGLGARAGYSTLNGIIITIICLTGTVTLINSVVPMEAGIAIVLWIGVVITAQAYQATPKAHAPAVAIGLFPAIAAWGATVTFGTFMAARGNPMEPNNALTMQMLLEGNPYADLSGFLLHGLIVLERGYIFTCMILAALSACLIDRKFFTAALWSAIGAVVTFLGICHAYQLSVNTVDSLLIAVQPAEGAVACRAHEVGIGYILMALLFLVLGLYAQSSPKALQAPEH